MIKFFFHCLFVLISSDICLAAEFKVNCTIIGQPWFVGGNPVNPLKMSVQVPVVQIRTDEFWGQKSFDIPGYKVDLMGHRFLQKDKANLDAVSITLLSVKTGVGFTAGDWQAALSTGFPKVSSSMANFMLDNHGNPNDAQNDPWFLVRVFCSMP